MPSDMDTHILNFYEDMHLPLSSVPRLIKSVMSGELQSPREKLDGQNFTFTVIGDSVRFMGKGCPKWIRAREGLNRDELAEHYADKPQVRDAFLGAYDALQHLVHSSPHELINSIFYDGAVVVQSEVVSPINRNVVRYSGNYVCIIGSQPIGARHFDGVMSKQLQRLQDIAHDNGIVNGWTIMGAPFVEFRPLQENDVIQENLIQKWNALTKSFGGNATMGDMLTTHVCHSLKNNVHLSGAKLLSAARRLAYDDASIISHREFPGDTWSEFKRIDDERASFVGEAILPIEEFFRELGSYAIDSYDFKLAIVDDVDHLTRMREMVNNAKLALKDGRLWAPEQRVLERAASAIRRADVSHFNKNVEGIVFVWNGELRKLTGAFTCVNRLNSYFAFERVRII